MPTRTTLSCCRRTTANGQESLLIETSSGQQIILNSSPASVSIEDANGNAVRLDAAGITITAATRLTIAAPIVEIASPEITFNSPLTTFNGILKADTILANSIAPGAGNVW